MCIRDRAERTAERYPGAELFWLMGKDQWDSLEQWGRWEYLSSLVQLYTGFVYRGPDLIRECVEAMKDECPVHR